MQTRITQRNTQLVTREAVCSNCVEVDFFLQDVNSFVVVEVNVTGLCTHLPGEEGDSSNFERRGRRLLGSRRQEKARLLVTLLRTPVGLHHRKNITGNWQACLLRLLSPGM